MQKLFFACCLSFTLFSSNYFAQMPAQIDVTSITINRIANADATFTINASGLPTPYQSPLTGIGEANIAPMNWCFPCYLGDVFRTDFSPAMDPLRYINGFILSGSSDNKRVKFTVTGTSSDIVLSPGIPLKKRSPVLTAAARIVGKIEIFDQNTLIAVDEDVDLTGTLKVEFANYRLFNSRRVFDFRNFTFFYSQ